MVMVSPKLNPQSCWEFEGDIMVLHHPTTIATRYRGFFLFYRYGHKSGPVLLSKSQAGPGR